ncbi:aldose epimerase family protein [Aestuariispira ectoiniformans]|uniref:aldose epimerase family protein n=1 Tax=Aestuariispira ectoiniformans TaxID=2775080 RepID=UPI00223BF9D9|nr:aldose epimerase family protein [Aestuariispira ectoiniformans]
MPDIEAVAISGHGLSARFLNYGATLQDLRLASVDRSLVLGFDEPVDYLRHADQYFGAMAGRYANRICEGRAVIGGRAVQLDRNFLDRHLLHGGRDGSSMRVWRVASRTTSSVTFVDRLPDGHMGFPGCLDVQVTFEILSGPALSLEVEAETDEETLCNFAHHAYFNLGGSASIEGHRLRIIADRYLPVTDTLIPTGALAAVKGSPFDFRKDAVLTAERLSTGYDHNYCLAERRVDLRPVARLSAPEGDVTMTIETTEPGLQFYDGAGINAGPYRAYAGLALEPQIWPDAPNHTGFPSALLRPGETYRQHTVFSFAQSHPPEALPR